MTASFSCAFNQLRGRGSCSRLPPMSWTKSSARCGQRPLGETHVATTSRTSRRRPAPSPSTSTASPIFQAVRAATRRLQPRFGRCIPVPLPAFVPRHRWRSPRCGNSRPAPLRSGLLLGMGASGRAPRRLTTFKRSPLGARPGAPSECASFCWPRATSGSTRATRESASRPCTGSDDRCPIATSASSTASDTARAASALAHRSQTAGLRSSGTFSVRSLSTSHRRARPNPR
jgi:hypothetical protein